MNVHTTAPPPLLVLIGIGFLAGACALAWFSSPFTLTATRTGPSTASVVIEDKLIGMFTIASESHDGVRAARSVVPRPEGSTSRTSTTRFLVLDTEKGQVFVGPSHHLLERHADELRDFLADPARAELVLRKLEISGELTRFIAAQAGVLFLALVGAFLVWLGCPRPVPRPQRGNRSALTRARRVPRRLTGSVLARTGRSRCRSPCRCPGPRRARRHDRDPHSSR